MMYRAVGVKTNFSLFTAKCTGEQQKLPQVLDRAMEEQSTHFIYITYSGKLNSSVLLTNEQCMEQLEWTQILPMAKCTSEQQKLPKFSK